VAVVRGHHLGARVGGEPDELGEDFRLLRQPVVHELDEEVVRAEDVLVLADRPAGGVRIAAGEGAGDLALEAAGERDQPLGVLAQERLVHPGAVVEARQVGLGDELDEVLVARLGRREDRQVVRVSLTRLGCRRRFLVAAVSRRDVRLDAEDRADALLQGLVVEGEGPEHVAVVGDRDRRHLELLDATTHLPDPVRAVEKGVLSVEVKMDEIGRHF
jgi:hypothetical protein